ncbi:MAG: DUF1905 domain-containing protein [Gracilibacteraceae bacterium]|nr:DUF1905 domain-containing protein [Gracilibacteraceae bacterium]
MPAFPGGDGTHFIALPAKVRAREKLARGDEVKVSFVLRERPCPESLSGQ